MNQRIETGDLIWDGEWEEIRIPLSSFTEMGSWDENQWFNPQGDYDWSAVDVFQLVEETGSMGNSEIWIDAIGIVEAGGTTVSNEIDVTPKKFVLNQNYPNPFNPNTVIRYQLSESNYITLMVFDALGREVTILQEGLKSAGVHTVDFDATGLASGIYFYKLTTSSGTEVKKMILLK